MLRIGEDRLYRPLFDNLAALHHADPVRDPPHDVEVVGDEQKAEPLARLQLGQQGKDLGLNGDVQRGGRLVGDQQIRPVGKGYGDHHALALAAGELVGVGWQPLLGPVDADLVQKLHHLRPCVRAAQALMQFDTLRQLLFDRVERVQRCHRLLKDEADVIAAHLAQDPFGGADHFPPVIADRPGQFGVVAQQADGGERRHGLA